MNILLVKYEFTTKILIAKKFHCLIINTTKLLFVCDRILNIIEYNNLKALLEVHFFQEYDYASVNNYNHGKIY